MKCCNIVVALAILSGSNCLAGVIALQSTNSWIDGSGKWETPGDWSAGAPVATNALVLITNAVSKLVTIDAATPPGNLAIDNLAISGPAGTLNTLQITNAPATTLVIFNSLAISNGGALFVTNSSVFVEASDFGEFSDDGTVTLVGGTINATNAFIALGSSSAGRMTVVGGTFEVGVMDIGYFGAQGLLTVRDGGMLNSALGFAPMYIGRGGPGQLIVSNATWLAGVSSPVYVGFDPSSQGNLTMVGATVNLLDGLSVGDGFNATGAVWQTGGTLLTTNSGVGVGFDGVGQMVLSNGLWQSLDVSVGISAGSRGTLTLAGGTATFLSTFSVASSSNASGSVWLTGGQLTTTNSPTNLGVYGAGRMTVSNGFWRAGNVDVGYGPGSQGTLTINGGTNIFSSYLYDGSAGTTSTVWMTGGQLITTNSSSGTVISLGGSGQMTISNGTCLTRTLELGGEGRGQGTLTVAGGSVTIFSEFDMGFGGTQALWQTGGQLNVTNGPTTIAYYDVGRMTVSNGVWRMRNVMIGGMPGSQGTLTVAGGVGSIYSNLTLGTTNCSATGTLVISGGELHVTNDAATAVLEVSNGTVIQTGGILDVDRLVVTNPCAQFIHTGGTLIYGILDLPTNQFADTDGDGMSNDYELMHGLDPLNPTDANLDPDGDGQNNLQEFSMGTDPNDAHSYFHISSIVTTNKDVLITWPTATMTGNGLSIEYYVQWGTTPANATNPLAFVFVFHGTPITSTNYLDVGGATNRPARFYRVLGRPNIG